jgi:DNA-binding NarL/FixJ family response regulator
MNPIRILLIDNNIGFLELVSDFLGSHEEVVVTGWAINEHDAVAQVVRQQPDVILLDIRMGDLSGLDLLPQLRRKKMDLAIIILTMYDLDVYRQAARERGADGYVIKKDIMIDLLPAIRAAMKNIPDLLVDSGISNNLLRYH